MTHDENCDVNDANLEGIKKPCNCGAAQAAGLAEAVASIKVTLIVDADGCPIKEGSVLQEVNDGERGVVVRIFREGDLGTIFDSVGDMKIQIREGLYRCSSRYKQWRHVPQDDQSYYERLLSWTLRRFDDDVAALAYGERLSKVERMAIDGIMALLPNSIVDWENGPWPDSLSQALSFLARHLSSITPDEQHSSNRAAQ